MRSTLGIVSLLCAFAAKPALADVEMRGIMGFGVTGKVAASFESPLTSMPLAFAISYEDDLFGSARYSLGAIFQHQIVSFKGKEGSTFKGSNALMGAVLGWHLIQLPGSFVRVDGAYYPSHSLSVTSDTTSTVNDEKYSHSTLTVFKGTHATEAGISWIVEETSGQFNRHERLRYGFSVTSLTQRFTRSEITIATSNPDIAPRSTVKEDVDYSLSLVSLNFVLGFAF